MKKKNLFKKILMFFNLSLQLLFLYPEIVNIITVDLENILWEKLVSGVFSCYVSCRSTSPPDLLHAAKVNVPSRDGFNYLT